MSFAAPSLPGPWLQLCPSLALLGTAALAKARTHAAGDIQPPVHLIYRTFELLRPDETKVVILGQDPYPTPGHAMGISFAVPYGRSWARTFINIAKEYESDLGFPLETSDLTPWNERGVLLANAALSVKTGAARSHSEFWRSFTDSWVAALANDQRPRVWVLWGKDAQEFEPLIGAGGSMQRILKSAHPSPLSARKGFFGSKPFSTVNQELAQLGLAPIDWSLSLQPSLF